MRFLPLARMGMGSLRARISGARIPLNVMVSVTNRCPSHCSYCDIPTRNQREMTLPEIRRLIDEMSEMGCVRLGIWGGEPLMRKDIGRIIDHAKERGMWITMDTNGYLMRERIDDIMNIDHLMFGLDGDEEKHDRNREKGSFRKTMMGIELARSRNLNVWTITVLTKHNLDAIPFILRTAKEYGLKATFQVLHHNDHLGRGGDDLRPDNDTYRNAILALIQAKKNGEPLGSSLRYLEYVLKWPDFASPMSQTQIDRLTCLAGQLYCNVDTDGTVYPCSLLIEDFPGKNFLQVGFREAFDNLKDVSCKSCVAACFTEYNYLFRLDAKTIWEWVSAMWSQ